jgi:serine protease AprX
VGKTFLTLCAVILSASLAFGGSRTLSRELENAKPGSTVDVIVQYKQVPTEAHYQRMKGRGGREKARLHSIKAAAFSLSASALKDWDADPDVAHVSLDHGVFPTSVVWGDEPPSTTTDFYDQAVNAPYAWSAGLNGSGIGIAVIDGSITDQGDFSGANGSRIVYSGNFNNDGINGDFGHGTHVAGILAGNGADSTGAIYTKTFKGIAPNANLLRQPNKTYSVQNR